MNPSTAALPPDESPAELDDDELADAEQRAADQAAESRRAAAQIEAPIIAALRAASPVQPVRFRSSDTFRFSCHRGVSCWNECCHDTDIMLTPNDMLRLARRLGERPAAVGARYTAATVHQPSGMPVLKLATVEGEGGRRRCAFLDPAQGCTVYQDRPAACRYYPLGLATVKMKGHDAPEDFYFLVKEAHCRGHEQDKEQTVAEYRKEQQVEEFDRVNRTWIHILMKLASWNSVGGPGGKAPDPRVMSMFLMTCADVDALRRFVLGSSFLQRYSVDPQVHEQLATDDELLLQLVLDWLCSVLFNEPTLHLQPAVLQQAIAKARTEMGAT